MAGPKGPPPPDPPGSESQGPPPPPPKLPNPNSPSPTPPPGTTSPTPPGLPSPGAGSMASNNSIVSPFVDPEQAHSSVSGRVQASKSKLKDKPGVISPETESGVPPKSTAAEMSLDESLSDAVLTDKGIKLIKKTPLTGGSDDYDGIDPISTDLRIEGNYNTSYLRYLDLVLVHYGFNNSPTFAEAFVAKPSPGYTPTLKISSNLHNNIDHLVLDMIPFVSVPGSSIDAERPRFSGNYLLDPENPFELTLLPNKNNIKLDASSVYQYFSYTPKTNHLRINWALLSSKGLFDFDLKVNFIDRGVELGDIPSTVNVFNTSAIDGVPYDFETLTARVLRSGNNENHRIILKEPERHDFEPYLNIENPSPANTGSGFDKNVTLKISRNLEKTSTLNGDYFTRLDIEHDTTFYNEPIFKIQDRSRVISITRPMASGDGLLSFYSTTFVDSYLFDLDLQMFHENHISRRLTHDLNGGTAKEGYTICSIRDNLNVLGSSSDISSGEDDSRLINDLEFRREYAEDELTNDVERKDLESNYFMYVNADKAYSSNKLNPIIEMKIDNRVTDDVTCSIGYEISTTDEKTKDNFTLKLVGLTRMGNLENPKVFAKELSLEWDSSNAFPWGKYTTYGSGTGSERDGFPLRCFCIKDLYDILSANLYGSINKGNPLGGSGSELSGLFPTLQEIYPESFKDSQESIVQFSTTREYAGHYLMPLSRLWLGNYSGNNYESTREKNIITITNSGKSSDAKDYIYCRGLEKTINLEDFVIMAPLARKLALPGVRKSIKTYQSHLSSGDFELKSKGGSGDSRFYKWNTVKDAIDILREGDQFGYVTKSLDDFEVENMFGRKCPTVNRKRGGSQRRLMGLASMGVSVYFYDDNDKFNGDDGWKAIPSYVLSNFYKGDSARANSFKKYIHNLKDSDKEFHIAYTNYSMFDAPGENLSPGAPGDYSVEADSDGLAYSFWTSRNNLTDWREEVYPHGFETWSGGNWWITYSTYNYRGSNLDDNYGKNDRTMLDLNMFGPEYQIMYEGGDDLSNSTRKISHYDYFDFSCDNDKILPNYNNIYDFLHGQLHYYADRTPDWNPNSSGIKYRFGNSHFYLSDNGWVDVHGDGPIKYSVSFLRDQSRDVSKIYIDDGSLEREVDLRSFDVIKEIRSLFGSSLHIESSADFSLQDEFPLWVSVFPEKPQPKPPGGEGYPFPYLTPPSYPGDYPGFLGPYQDPYAINLIDIDPDIALGMQDFGVAHPKADTLDPYEVVPGPPGQIDISIVTGRPIYTQTITLGLGESSDVLYRKHSFNTSLFEFYMNDSKYGTLHDLSNDMNKKLLSKGVRFTDILDFSRFYTPDKILDSGGEVSVIDKAILNTNRVGLTLFSGVKGDEFNIKGEYTASSRTIDNVFSVNVKFRKNDSLSSSTPIVESNLLSGRSNDSRPPGLRRNRFRDDVQDLLKTFIENRSEQASRLIHESKNNSDLLINVGQYEIGTSDPGVNVPFRSQPAGGPEGDEVSVGIQVGLGGFAKSGDLVLFDSPNSYFEPNYNVFFPLEFSVKETEMVVLIVRSRNQDGSYSPSDLDDYSAYRASISYSNGLFPEYVTGVTESQVPGANFLEFEELLDGTIDEVSPSVIMVPIKAPVNNVLIRNDFHNLEISVKITNSPESLDEFGFLAINRNNFNFNMQESKVSDVFGLVLDYLGAWDIMISPEAIVNRQPSGAFNYLGLGYNRQVLDTDEGFLGGIGISNPFDAFNEGDDFDESLNDIFIDDTVIPEEIRDSIRLIQVPSYPKVFILQIDPGVKEYLSEIRSAAGPNSQEGCYVDIPLFFKGKKTGAEGSCSIRIFYDVSCVFDYNLCDFFWNLSGPPALSGTEVIENNLDVIFSDYADCYDESYRDDDDNIISKHYVDCKISNVPMLDSGNALVLIKAPKNILNVSQMFKPSEEALQRILYVIGEGPVDTPWELDCDLLSEDEINVINKPVIYPDPTQVSLYVNNLSDIMNILETGDNYMFIHPQFYFPEQDIKGNCYSDEQIILGIGMAFKNWRTAPDQVHELRSIIGVEAVLPSNIITDFNIPLCVKYFYNEDRQIR